MKKLLALAAIATIPLGSLIAQEQRMFESINTQDPQTKTWQGYLVDANYAAKIPKNPDQAAEYSKRTAMEDGPKNGFGILVDSQWLKFDDAGDAKALEVIKNSTRDSGFLVTVTGTLSGDTISVTSITETYD